MIHIKKENEIAVMREGGKILADVLSQVMDRIKPGVTELELDRLAEELILQKGGSPGFKKVKGYKYSTCLSTNDVVVHGIPTDYSFKERDVVGVDCGVYYKGFHTDMAETRRVSTQNSKGKTQSSGETGRFLDFGKKALEAGIAAAKGGNRIGHISKAIQDIVEKQGGYSVVRSLIGHGVGKNLHEEPEVPGFLQGEVETTPLLVPGMTIAVEVIYNMGAPDVVYKNSDGWTISTKDDSVAGLFERTILITEGNPEVLTSMA